MTCTEKWQAAQQRAAQMQEYTPIAWDRMPELELYMDQVITFMEKQLAFYRRTPQSKMLTSSMINNYVKEALLHRPVNKRYNRMHLAELMVVSMLKPILTMADISDLKQSLVSAAPEDLYENFISAQTEAFREVGQQVAQLCASETTRDDVHLALLAMQLALRANAYRVAAEHLLELLVPEKTEEPKPSKERKSDKKTVDPK